MPSGIYLLIGCCIGGIVGYVIALLRRAPSQVNTALESELRTQVQQRTGDAARLQQQSTELAKSLATAEANRDAAQRMLADARAQHAAQMQTLEAAQEKMTQQLRESFQSLSVETLNKLQPQFLQLATERLGQFQESAKGDVAQRQQAIATLVEPLKQHLEVYQRRLSQAEANQSATLGEVKKQVEQLALNSQVLSSETLQLRRVLSSNQARGRWGEETLRRVVEAAGMSAHCDFLEQSQSEGSKPDLIVKLPGERVIIIDAKVPDLDFLTAIDAADPVKRSEALALHAAKLKATIRALGERDYPKQFEKSLDHVVLFIPAESLFSAALEGDRDLIVWATGRQIMLATPASLIALLRSVSVSWQQHSQTENAREIAAAAQELYSRIAKFSEHFEKMRAGLDKANSAFNDAVGSFERSVRPSGERLVKLGCAPAGKEIAEVSTVTNEPRRNKDE